MMHGRVCALNSFVHKVYTRCSFVVPAETEVKVKQGFVAGGVSCCAMHDQFEQSVLGVRFAASFENASRLPRARLEPKRLPNSASRTRT
eukprot:4784707-Prymnesium_polylepis.1